MAASIDDAILNKVGPVTEEESQRLRDHCVLGYLFVRDSLRLGGTSGPS